MPLPKRRHSSTRRDKRRTHDSLKKMLFQTCKVTKVEHRPHIAYEVNGKLYYNGKVVIDYEDELAQKDKEKALKKAEKEAEKKNKTQKTTTKKAAKSDKK